MKKLTLILSMLIALIGLQANAAMYIVGSGPFGNWNPGGGVEMTDNGDGTYSKTVTLSGKVLFVFGDGLNGDWSIFNRDYRYGPATGDTTIGANTWIATAKAGDHGAYVFNGTGLDYEIIFDENNHQFKVAEVGGTPDPDPDVYIMGEVNGNGWAPNVGYKMTQNESVYTADITTAGENNGLSYFSFTKKLAEGNSDADWAAIAPYRFGADSDGDFWMTEELLGQECALVNGGQAIAIPAGEWTVTVNLDTYKFTINGTWPVDTVIPEPEADVYIMGEVNGNGWAPNVGYKMTQNESVYTANITTAGENDGKSYFSFTKKLAEGNSDADWATIAPYRFGADSDGDFWMTEELLGQECALVNGGQAIAIPAGEWTVTVNLDTYKFTIDGTWPVDTVIPEPEANVYILGEVNGNGWAADKGVQMTLNEGVYTANITTTGENDGKSYFSFTKMLAEGNEEADWAAIAPYRFGAESDGDFWMTEELLGQECALVDNGQAIAIPAGEWTVTVNLNTYKFTIDGTWPVDTVIPEPEADVYILGEVNGNGWAANLGVKMTLNEGVYTANITTAGENDGKSYFSFTKQLADSANGWDDITPYRFGAESDGDFWMTEELLGVECALVDNGQAIAIPAGEWTVTVNLDTYKFTIDGTWPVDTVIPEPEADVYIIGEVNGNIWATNVGVKMTLNEGVYTANITTAGENDGKSYFSFTKMLADSAADWEAIAPYRFGPVSEGDFIMTEELLGVPCALTTDGSNAIAIPAGEWTVTVDLEHLIFTITGEWPDVPGPEPYTGDVYIMGEVNDNGGWFTNKGVKMTRDAENNLYTAIITTAGENIPEGEEAGYSYFSFTKQLADSAADWDAIAPYRFGALSDGDFWVTDETLGTEITLTNNGQAFRVPAGTWELTLSVDNMTLVINKKSFELGDVNHDSDVNIGDVTTLISLVLKGNATPESNPEANCNQDNEIGIGDVTALISRVLKGTW